MKRLGFIQRGRSMEKIKQTKTRQHSDDTQISRPDLRFASRESSEPKQKRGRSHNTKKPHQDHQDCLRHDRGKPNVSPKYAQNELASLWPKKGVKSCATVKSSNKIVKVYCTLRQPPQSPLRRAVSIFEQVGQLRKFLQLPKSMGAQSVGGCRDPRTRHSSVIRSW